MYEIKLMIFDLDGTIINSEELNFKSYKEALMEIGVIINREDFNSNINSKHYLDFLPQLIPNSDINIVENVHNRKQEIYKNNLNNIEVHPFIKNIINNSKDKKLALATTAGRIAVESVLKVIGLYNSFDLILTGDDVKKRKPNSEVFLKCIEHFGVRPQETIIFEDSDIGLEAAHKTNAWIMKVERWFNN